MGFLAEVKRGQWGLRFAIPNRLKLTEDTAESVSLVDTARRVMWHLSRYDYRLDLRPEHHARLLADVERHARDLFETFFRQIERPAGMPARPPRTADSGWSPVVSVERERVGTSDALAVVHRMSYEPMHEVIMGHLLVPLQRGLFEFRIIAQAQMTGMRESLLFNRALAASSSEDPEALMIRLGQTHYDDPRHDSDFPDHPLSVVRSELRWLLEQGSIEVIEPAEPPSGEVMLPGIGGAITPPPRYLQMKSDGPDFARFSRVSFAGTDGVQILTVCRVADSRIRARARGRNAAQTRQQKLLKIAEDIARLAPSDATDLYVETKSLPDEGVVTHAMAYRTYSAGQLSPQHTVFRWFTDAEDVPIGIILGTSQCVPKTELFEEAEAVVASWRPIDDDDGPISSAPPAAKKKWWQFW